LSTWTLYNACKTYGSPRVYRRLLEQNRIINHVTNNREIRQRTQQLARLAIEAPPQFVTQLAHYSESTVLPFLHKIAQRAEPSLPKFLVAIVKYIVQSQNPVKLMQDLAAGAAKRATKK
jgi:hypothetical protein